MATKKTPTKKKTKKASVYRAHQAFRRKNPEGQWVQFKPWNRYKLADIKWVDDYKTLFHTEEAE